MKICIDNHEIGIVFLYNDIHLFGNPFCAFFFQTRLMRFSVCEQGRPRLEKAPSGVGGNADAWREHAYKHLTIDEVRVKKI